MLIFSEEKVIEQFKEFTDEQLNEMANCLRRSIENKYFSSRRVSEDLLGLVCYEITRRNEIK